MQVLEESLYSELSSDRLILSNSQWIYISRSVNIHTTDGSENRQQLPSVNVEYVDAMKMPLHVEVENLYTHLNARIMEILKNRK